MSDEKSINERGREHEDDAYQIKGELFRWLKTVGAGDSGSLNYVNDRLDMIINHAKRAGIAATAASAASAFEHADAHPVQRRVEKAPEKAPQKDDE